MSNKKLSPLYILKILNRYSDADHYLSQPQIKSYLETEYNCKLDRKTIGNTLYLLSNEMNYGIDVGNNGKGFAFIERTFDDSEILFLIDMIVSAQYITTKQTDELINKLLSFTSKYFRVNHKNTLDFYTDLSCGKTNNQEFFYTIEQVLSAIDTNAMITFDYYDYDADFNLVPTGRSFQVNPHFIANQHGNQHLFATYSRGKRLYSFNLEKIRNLKILPDKQQVSLDDIPEIKGIKLHDYIKSHPYSFVGNTIDMEIWYDDPSKAIRISNSFGSSNTFIEKKDNHWICHTKSDINSATIWAIQYSDDHMKVIGCPELIDRIKEHINKLEKTYK